jgi:hypothetical protein
MPIVTTDRRVEFSRPGVLPQTTALDEEKAIFGRFARDPDVDRPMPVAVAVDLGPRFDPAGRRPVGADDVEELCRILRDAIRF